jgi:hypothetical protein
MKIQKAAVAVEAVAAAIKAVNKVKINNNLALQQILRLK